MFIYNKAAHNKAARTKKISQKIFVLFPLHTSLNWPGDTFGQKYAIFLIKSCNELATRDEKGGDISIQFS